MRKANPINLILLCGIFSAFPFEFILQPNQNKREQKWKRVKPSQT